MKYGFIKEQCAQYPIVLMCSVFDVSRSGYYSWVHYIPSNRVIENKKLDEEIASVFSDNKSRYGSPRITRALNKKGLECNYKRVAKRMKLMNLKAVAKRKYRVTTDSEHTKPVFENILNRDFSTTGVNQKWAGDITYVATKEGWLYLSVIIDLHSRAIIGWSMSERMSKQLVCDALLMALFNRKFPKGVIVQPIVEANMAPKNTSVLWLITT